MVSMLTSVRSDSAPMVSRGFVFMLWIISVVAPGSEPSDDLYSMLDQLAFVGTGGTCVGQSSSPRGGQAMSIGFGREADGSLPVGIVKCIKELGRSLDGS